MNSNFIIDVNESNFDIEVINYSNNIPVVVDFWAEWCVPCKMLDPILRKLTEERSGEFRLAKVNVDENQSLAMRFNVRSIPSVKAFRGGQMVAEFSGIQPEPKITNFLNEIIPTPYDLNLNKANSLLLSEKWQAAYETFKDVLDSRPGNTPALLGLAKSLVVQGRGGEARDILNAFPVSTEFAIAEKIKPVALALSRFEKKQPESDTAPIEATYNHALRLIGLGNLPAAIDGLLEVLRQDKSYRSGEVRQVILGLFEILGTDNPITRQYQAELASVLF
jgi:putative thioredoxin